MENFDLKDFLPNGRAVRDGSLDERIHAFNDWIQSLKDDGILMLRREHASATDAEVTVWDEAQQRMRSLIMYGSNSYLSLSTHPRVVGAVQDALQTYGTGPGGPPMLNGTTLVHTEAERKVSTLKGTGDTVLFSTGYQAQLAWVTALVDRSDTVLYDAGCHASFFDGLKASGARGIPFRHNNIEDLATKLEAASTTGSPIWITVEGVYSMDGDLAPLREVVQLAKKYQARVVVDDAHGTGILGAHGSGTPSHFGINPDDIYLHLGTFSKAYSVTGGFLSGATNVITYLRYMARTHMFSAALPTTTVAAVCACIDVIRDEPDRVTALHDNVRSITMGLQYRGFDSTSESGIVPIRLAPGSSALAACAEFAKKGIFVNGVEYPAVPRKEPRLRVSVMSSHTNEHIHHLLTTVEEVLSPSLVS